MNVLWETAACSGVWTSTMRLPTRQALPANLLPERMVASSDDVITTTTMPPPPTGQSAAGLPVNVLLEIVVRSDITTAIRCAATSKILRRAILDQAFRRRLHLPDAAADARGFDPALLRAPFEPVSSRDGLLVLRRRETDGSKNPDELRVCNTFTGHVTRLPPMDVLNHHEFACDNYRPALLTSSGDGSFEVLVMDAFLRVQIFSSKDGGGRCGATRTVAPPPDHQMFKPYALQTSPTIIGRTVHYLCHSSSKPSTGPGDDMFVLALDADDAAAAQAAAAIELPEGSDKESCSLAVTADGKLSFLVADAEAIVVWAMASSSSPEEEGWIRQAVIGRRRIHEQVAGGGGGQEVVGKAVFQGFGERSGAVLLHIDMVGLVLLDVETEKAVLLHACSKRDRRAYQYAGRGCMRWIWCLCSKA